MLTTATSDDMGVIHCTVSSEKVSESALWLNFVKKYKK